MTRLTDEQLAMRRQGIGSSDITAILGVSPYADHTPISVLMDKRGLVHRKPEDETPAMRLGHMLEDVAATMYVDDFGVELVKCSTIQSIAHPWAMATLDRRVVVRPGAADRLVECKAVGSWMLYDRETGVRRWDKGDPNGIPYDVRVQVTWQMLVSGVHEAHVAAILGGTDFAVYPVAYDAELAERLISIGGAWWHRFILEGEDPDMDGSDAARAYLKARYPEVVRPGLLASTPEQDAAAATWQHAQREEKRWKLEREKLSQDFIAAIGDASGIKGDGWQCTYKAPPAGGSRRFILRPTGVRVTNEVSDE